MKKHWAKEFIFFAEKRGFKCTAIRHVNGWLETLEIAGHRCFMKSMTYNLSSRQYFQGIDPNKLKEAGDAVMFCGGRGDKLKDIFVIPWQYFFNSLRQASPINTYKNREYAQYKLHIRNRNNRWTIFFQGGHSPKMDVTQWCYTPDAALNALSQNNWKT